MNRCSLPLSRKKNLGLTVILVILVCCSVVAVDRSVAGDLEALKERAAKGDAIALYELGLNYHDGKGVQRDYSEALKWFRLAAEKGNAGAMNMVGVMYHDGLGVPKDYAEAA
ncbi:hypothetical protein ACFL2Q_19845, partial [Thermodesulfobacteriota bacterium]